MKGATPQPIWGSLACGRNLYLNSHLDEDFFYSLTNVASKHGLQEGGHRYSMERSEADISILFAFPEQEGIAVVLRPGDMILFNPRYQHCLPTCTSMFHDNDVFCLAL